MIRYGSLVTLSILSVAVVAVFGEHKGSLTTIPVWWITGSAILLISLAGLRKEISVEKILYGIALLCMVLSI
jgi:hypothetical protein